MNLSDGTAIWCSKHGFSLVAVGKEHVYFFNDRDVLRQQAIYVSLLVFGEANER